MENPFKMYLRKFNTGKTTTTTTTTTTTITTTTELTVPKALPGRRFPLVGAWS